MPRSTARAATLAATSAALLLLAAGTATAGSDERCERADGVVVCLPTAWHHCPGCRCGE